MIFQASCKSAIISSFIKKQGLNYEIFKNYRFVANLSFISKIIEKAIATQIHSHLINNVIVDNCLLIKRVTVVKFIKSVY